MGPLYLLSLSIWTVLIVEDRPRPYEDGFDGGGLLKYRRDQFWPKRRVLYERIH